MKLMYHLRVSVSDKWDIIIVSDKAVWYTKALQVMVSVISYRGHAGN